MTNNTQQTAQAHIIEGRELDTPTLQDLLIAIMISTNNLEAGGTRLSNLGALALLLKRTPWYTVGMFWDDSHLAQFRAFCGRVDSLFTRAVTRETLTVSITINSPAGAISFQASQQHDVYDVEHRDWALGRMRDELSRSAASMLPSPKPAGKAPVAQPEANTEAESESLTGEAIAVNELVVSYSEDGDMQLKIRGGEYQKYGVPLYPEVATKCLGDGYADELKPGRYKCDAANFWVTKTSKDKPKVLACDPLRNLKRVTS